MNTIRMIITKPDNSNHISPCLECDHATYTGTNRLLAIKRVADNIGASMKKNGLIKDYQFIISQ